MDAIASPSAAEISLIRRFLTGLQPKSDIPLRLTLWNGLQHDFGKKPRVTVKLHGPGAIRYFLPPRLDKMAEGYVNGHFDIQGRAQDIVDAAASLARVNSLLKDGGLLPNHGITSTDPGSGTAPLGAASFIEKYVFPNGELPHISLALKALQSRAYMYA